MNGKHICEEWNIPIFHYRHININHLENETCRPRRRWRETTILEAKQEILLTHEAMMINSLYYVFLVFSVGMSN
jgi:hypothetical protein